MKLKKSLMGVIVAVAMLASMGGLLFVTSSPASAATAVAASTPLTVTTNLRIQRATMAVYPHDLSRYRNGRVVALLYQEVFYLQDHPRTEVIKFVFQGPYGAIQQQQIRVAPHQRVVVANQVRNVVVQHGRTYTAFVYVTQPQRMTLWAFAHA